MVVQYSRYSLRDYARTYDCLAKVLYGFKRVEYPRGIKTYAMNPKTKALLCIVPEAIPAIPYPLRINFIQAGVAHEAGHLENVNSLCKAIDLLDDKDYLDGRNRSFLKDLFNIIVDVSHERCIGEKFIQDKVNIYTMWSNIEDNFWRLEKLESVKSEDGKENEPLKEELQDFNEMFHYLALTQREIPVNATVLPERYESKWNEIEDRVLAVVHSTFDSVKILDAAKIFYDIIIEQSKNLGEQLEKNAKMKIKVIRVTGIPSGMSLPGGSLDLSEFDPENIEEEEMSWEDYLDSLGEDREDFMGKMVKNKNDEDSSKGMEKDSKTFERDENGNMKHSPSRETKGGPSGKARKTDEYFPEPIHVGSGNKCVVTDYDEILNAEKDISGYLEAVNFIKDKNRLKVLLKNKLINLSNDKVLRDQTSGRLDSRQLVRARLMRGVPEKPIHKKIIRSRSYKRVACSLVIDESGSMGSSRKYFHARCAAILFAEILRDLKIDNEIMGFTTSHNGHSGYPSCVNRHEPLRHTFYKKFGEQIEKEKLGAISANCNNADGESVLYAGMRIACRNADRRIMFVFSDGYPQAHCDYNMQEDLKNSIRICELNGIEVIGIGICSDAPKKFYPNYVLIDDASCLTSEFYAKLDEILSSTR